MHIESFQWILNNLGKKVDTNALEKLMGLTPQAIIRKYFPNMPEDEIWTAALRKEEYLYRLDREIKVNEGAKEFLNEIGKRGIKRIVISSTHRSLVNRLLNTVDLIDYLDAMVCGDEIINGKPDPEPFLKGLEKSGFQQEWVIGIGDSIYDGMSSTAAGIQFIGITTGKTDCHTLLLNDNECVINSFKDLKLVRK
jgi:HAD superfamily hydrolase (TIGR01549 family)